ncbi:MAG: winged helix-turn-helix transcriptional regulator, partial [Thermoplasmata archaeon]
EAAPAPAASVTYAIEAGAYNNTIHLGPSGILSSPRVVTGPDPGNPARGDVYVLGLNDTGLGPCSNLTVFRSTDAGTTFHATFPSGVCLAGSAVDAVALGNGTLVVAAAGPTVLRSTDGGAHWSNPLVLGGSTSLPSLSVDPISSALYLTWTGNASNSTGGLFVASSRDGGVSWRSPMTVLPATLVAEQPELAVHGSSVAVAFLEMFTIPLPPPDPPPTGNNSTTPPPSGAPVDALAAVSSSDGGATWGVPQVIVPQNLSLQVGEPSLAVSSTGTFGIAWSQDNVSSGPSGTFAAMLRNGGSTWSTPVPVSTTGPPLIAPTTFGHTAGFDAAGRLYVTWHNYSADNPLAAQLNVAISNRSLDSFATSSFALAFRSEVGNGTQSENLAADEAGRVFLAWDVFGPWNDPSYGVFVRTVSGEAVGSLSNAADGTTVTVSDAATGATVGEETWEGHAFTLVGLAADSYEVSVTRGNQTTLAGTIPVVPWGATSFVVQGVSVAASGSPSFPYPFAILGVSLVTAGAMGALYYTRLTRETVLRQKLRSLIFEYIVSEPGASFSAVREALGLQNGTTAYHLNVLEREGFVQSVVRGRGRYYFPVGGAVTDRELPLSGIQASIVKAVETTPGLGLRELSRAVGREPSSVSYSTRVLAREGRIKSVRAGLHLRFYPLAPAATSTVGPSPHY